MERTSGRKTEYSCRCSSMTKDHRGITLVELVSAVAIIAAFCGILAVFISTASAGYRSASGGARVQMETQEAVSQIQELLVDANWSVSYGYGEPGYSSSVSDDMSGSFIDEKKNLTVCSVREKDSSTAECVWDTLTWDPEKKTVSHSRSRQDYLKVYPSVTPLPDGTTEDPKGAAFALGEPVGERIQEFSGAVVAQDITDFHMDVSGAAADGVVRFRIETEKAGRSIETEHTVYLRNELPKN